MNVWQQCCVDSHKDGGPLKNTGKRGVSVFTVFWVACLLHLLFFHHCIHIVPLHSHLFRFLFLILGVNISHLLPSLIFSTYPPPSFSLSPLTTVAPPKGCLAPSFVSPLLTLPFRHGLVSRLFCFLSHDDPQNVRLTCFICK